MYILYEELLFELALRSHFLEKLEMAIAVQNYELKAPRPALLAMRGVRV